MDAFVKALLLFAGGTENGEVKAQRSGAKTSRRPVCGTISVQKITHKREADTGRANELMPRKGNGRKTVPRKLIPMAGEELDGF